MDCKTLTTIFAGERADDLSAAESQAFEQHLDACAPCRERLAGAERTLDDLAAQWEPPQPSELEWARVTRDLRAELDRPVLQMTPPVLAAPRRNLELLFAMAAAVLFLLGVAFVLSSQDGRNGLSSESVGMATDDAPGKKKKGTKTDGKQNTSQPKVTVSEIKLTPPPAEVVELEAAEGFAAEHELIGDDLLLITIREKA